MKKLLTILAAVLLFQTAQAQIYKNAWSLGFSLNSVRMTAETRAEALDLGGNFFVQKDINETHAFRGILSYGHLTSKGVTSPSTDNFMLGLDYLLKFAQQGPIYPYFGAGFAISYFDVSGSPIGLDGGHFGELSANLFFGAVFDIIGDDWKLKGEFQQHTLSTDSFDGVYGTEGGLFGGSLDSYIEFGVGLQYYFDKGEVIESSLPGGVANAVNYDKIEEINRKYAPTPDTKKVDALQKQVDALNSKIDKLLNKLNTPEQAHYEHGSYMELENMFFEVNSTDLNPGSYDALVQLVNVMKNDRSMNIELVGHTDNTGSAKYNEILGQKRAQFVKDYCVKNGISASRIRVSSRGEDAPVADNNTAGGRALNRRVEVKILK